MDLKKQRVQVSLDLPGSAMSLSSRLNSARGGSLEGGPRAALGSTKSHERGAIGNGSGSRDDRATGGGGHEEGEETLGFSKRGRTGRADDGVGEDGPDGIPKVCFRCAKWVPSLGIGNTHVVLDCMSGMSGMSGGSYFSL